MRRVKRGLCWQERRKRFSAMRKDTLPLAAPFVSGVVEILLQAPKAQTIVGGANEEQHTYE